MDFKTKKIRTVLCTSGGITGAIFLQRFLSCPKIEIVGVVLSQKWSSRGIYQQIQRCGLLYSFYLWIMIRFMERLGNIFRIFQHASTSAIAKSHKIPILYTKDVNSEESHDFFSRFHTQLLLSAYCDLIFKDDLCDGKGSYQTVNLHPGILPDNKGIDPVFYDVLDASDFVGITLHRVTSKIDGGRILGITKLHRDPKKSVLGIKKDLAHQGADLLIHHFPTLLFSSTGLDQKETGICKSYPTRNEVKKLYKNGGRLFYWRDFFFNE